MHFTSLVGALRKRLDCEISGAMNQMLLYADHVCQLCIRTEQVGVGIFCDAVQQAGRTASSAADNVMCAPATEGFSTTTEQRKLSR